MYNSQEILDNPTDTTTMEEPADVEQENPVVDSFLLSALASQRERMLILKLDRELEHFVQNTAVSRLQFPPMSSYNRMIIHKMAQHFKLEHNVVDIASPSFPAPNTQQKRAVVLFKTSESRTPVLRFADLYREETKKEDTGVVKLLKRNQIVKKPDSRHPPTRIKPKRGPSNGSHPPTILSREPESAVKRDKTLEEREEEYAKARARIFEEFESQKATLPTTASPVQTNAVNTDPTPQVADVPSPTKVVELSASPTSSPTTPRSRESTPPAHKQHKHKQPNTNGYASRRASQTRKQPPRSRSQPQLNNDIPTANDGYDTVYNSAPQPYAQRTSAAQYSGANAYGSADQATAKVMDRTWTHGAQGSAQQFNVRTTASPHEHNVNYGENFQAQYARRKPVSYGMQYKNGNAPTAYQGHVNHGQNQWHYGNNMYNQEAAAIHYQNQAQMTPEEQNQAWTQHYMERGYHPGFCWDGSSSQYPVQGNMPSGMYANNEAVYYSQMAQRQAMQSNANRAYATQTPLSQGMGGHSQRDQMAWQDQAQNAYQAQVWAAQNQGYNAYNVGMRQQTMPYHAGFNQAAMFHRRSEMDAPRRLYDPNAEPPTNPVHHIAQKMDNLTVSRAHRSPQSTYGQKQQTNSSSKQSFERPLLYDYSSPVSYADTESSVVGGPEHILEVCTVKEGALQVADAERIAKELKQFGAILKCLESRTQIAIFESSKKAKMALGSIKSDLFVLKVWKPSVTTSTHKSF